MPDLHVFPDTEALAAAAAEEIASRLREAIEQRGRASFVLTGGDTPKPVYRLLASDYADALDWGQVHVFWGDDRFVPPDDEQSNLNMARETMLNDLSIPDCNIYPIPTTLPNAEAAAAAYHETLQAFFAGDAPAFDVLLLGLGSDRHIGSLWPGTEDVREEERWVIHTESPPHQPVRDRVTMTMPLLKAGRTTIFLVAGEGKAEAARAAIEQNEGPAARVTARDRLAWYLDEEAAAQLSSAEGV